MWNKSVVIFSGDAFQYLTFETKDYIRVYVCTFALCMSMSILKLTKQEIENHLNHKIVRTTKQLTPFSRIIAFS